MNTVSDKVKPQDCCGCGACYNKCPVGAISMQENEEGFLTPVIDEAKCTNCGLCLKACPSLNTEFKNNPQPECYAAMADDEIRMKSSSGGIFTLLAEYILDKGGYVCGAAFDDNWDVHHIIIDNKNDLDKLRGSKYVQSNTENCYKQIKKLLDEDKYVLFSGCPCQVAGLYAFLGKNYEKLYTMDLICHGSPSRKVWRRYLQENFDVDNIKNVSFRDKSVFGWATTMNIYFKNNDESYHNIHTKDPFFRGFVPCMISNEHCGICKYTKLPRQGDISLGDWWGIDKFKKGLNDGKGTSQVLINSNKGKFLYEEISSLLKINDNIGLETTLKSINKTIYQPFPVHHSRGRFFKDLNKFPITKQLISCNENKYDVCLTTTFYAKNYGAILVAYAVNRIIENLGYSILMLQKPEFVWRGYPIAGTIPADFAQKYYNISRVYKDEQDLISLNNHCENFVVGSDQLFKPVLHLKQALLDYVNILKNKICFGTSFGQDKYNVQTKQVLETKYLLHRFNHIALREKGENISNIFDLQNVSEVIDPTLMLPVQEYNKLSENVEFELPEKYLLTYTLDINKDKENVIQHIADKLNLEVLNIANPEEKHRRKSDLNYIENVSPELFLYLYKNASFIVTDSYHGSCFAIKFNKPFISLVNTNRGALRYKLFDKLKVKHRFVEKSEDVYNNDELLKPVDYTETNKIIEQESEYAINWLKNALENNNSSEKFSDYENYMDLKIKELSCKIAAIPEPPEPVIINNYNNDAIEHKYLLLGNKNHINKKYYRYKWLAKIMLGKKRKHYKEKAKIFHEKVREIRRLEKEAELC